MRKFIKINLIILVIFCLSCSLIIKPINATSNEEENTKNQEVISNEENNNQNSDENTENEEKNLDDLQLEKSELENQINSSNEQIQFIESDLSAIVVEISEINQKILDKQMEIETLEAQEKDLLAYIEKAEYELNSSNDRYEKQKELLEKRLVAMYELGSVSYLDLILNSKSITEFLSNYYLISEITSADEELLQNVEAEKKYNKKLKETLETKRNVLTASRETREKNAISLANMAVIKNNKLLELTDEQAALQKMVEEYQNQIAEIETEIRLLAIANVGKDYVGGSMAWPVPGYTRITSSFGMRTHPITGVYKLHTGVDIGAPMGANFIAANDGIVTYAGYNTAYGNMVIVDHGGGITTLYAHGSEILVQVGQTVLQGTPILKVGATGYATGPHAHFEVRINGEYVQPLDYITSYNSQNEDNNTAEETVAQDVKLQENQTNNESQEESTEESETEGE
ncbi:MAG TPA: peptidoglycan DD-metalloendopeptidase family protein [Candidatus Scatovivens faecipullorum]|nr:peptidoglycan DD-metalloendopeptidase family protein [Candidatus Scatovivens faecipullorum]